jgi:hypothetical protein
MMADSSPSTSLVPVQPVFTDAERLALAGYLAGYRSLTREAYTLDLRQFTGWCRSLSLPLFSVRRADVETFARELEARGRARATVTRRLSTIAGFYKYAVEEEHLDHSPPLTSGGRGWTTNHTPPPWTATKSAHSWTGTPPILWPPTSPERPGISVTQSQQGSLAAVSGQTAAAPLEPQEIAIANRRSVWPWESSPPAVEVCRSGRSGAARGAVPLRRAGFRRGRSCSTAGEPGR